MQKINPLFFYLGKSGEGLTPEIPQRPIPPAPQGYGAEACNRWRSKDSTFGVSEEKIQEKRGNKEKVKKFIKLMP